MKTEIKNAVIESVSLDIADRGLLTAWVSLDYGGSCQGFGGHALYLPKSFTHHKPSINFAGLFIYRTIQVAGVGKWEDLKGKTIRARIEDGIIKAIGHIVKDDWFDVAKEFEELK